MNFSKMSSELLVFFSLQKRNIDGEEELSLEAHSSLGLLMNSEWYRGGHESVL